MIVCDIIDSRSYNNPIGHLLRSDTIQEVDSTVSSFPPSLWESSELVFEEKRTNSSEDSRDTISKYSGVLRSNSPVPSSNLSPRTSPKKLSNSYRPQSLFARNKTPIVSENRNSSYEEKVNITRKAACTLKTLIRKLNQEFNIKGANIHRRFFTKILSKCVFYQLAKGNNIFSRDKPIPIRSLFRKYDIGWIRDRLSVVSDQVEEVIGKLYGNVVNFSTVNEYSTYTTKSFKDGIYTFREWKNYYSITQEQYNLLRRRYWGPSSDFNDNIFLLLLRYNSLESMNSHCSIPPILTKKYQLGEFFGSPFNATSDVYYSPFEDIENLFGSKGNFFTAKIDSGTYIANPPFDPLFVDKMFKRIAKIMERISNITIVVNIPNYGDREFSKDFDFVKTLGCELDKKDYFVERKVLSKDKYKHYEYYSGKFIPVCTTQLVLLSNDPSRKITNLKEFRKTWKNACK